MYCSSTKITSKIYVTPCICECDHQTANVNVCSLAALGLFCVCVGSLSQCYLEGAMSKSIGVLFVTAELEIIMSINS